jgi:hypothetical protein
MIVSRAAARELEVHVVRGGGCSIARQLAITDSQSPETPQGDRTNSMPPWPCSERLLLRAVVQVFR